MPSLLPASRSTCAFVGMIHLRPLPGSPGSRRPMTEIIGAALDDARALKEGGCDALLIENMGDVPYLKGAVYPETVAAAAVCADRIAQLGLPIGIQILAAANREALGVALASGASFVRAEGFAYAHVADEGWIDACAGELLRVRAALTKTEADGRPSIAVWADIKKKHSAHAVTADVNIAEIAEGTAFCGADALVVTGSRTGSETKPADIQAARTSGLPVVVGSGIDANNAGTYAAISDALIVGTSLKVDGRWRNPVDPDRVRDVRAAIDRAVK